MMFRKDATPSDPVKTAFLEMVGERVQSYRANNYGRWPSLTTVTVDDPDPNWALGNEILQSEGVWDMGIGLEKYGAARVLVPPMFQAIYTGELTPAEAAERFYREATEAIR
jgi:hypothetical protein